MNLIKLSLTIFSALTFLACDKKTGDTEFITTEDAMRAGVSILTAAKDLAPSTQQIQSLTHQELESLYAFEYKVFEIAEDTKQEEIAKQLSALGSEHWDCFSMLPRGEKILVSCKRRPASTINLIKNLSPLIRY